MKMFSDCSGECCVCACGCGCLAGNGDDDFQEATASQILERLDKGQYSDYRNYMIQFLLERHRILYVEDGGVLKVHHQGYCGSIEETVDQMLSKMGEDFEIDVAIEEMSELIKELVKYKRSKVLKREKQATSREHVVEEMGDVLFMMEYLKRIFNISDSEVQEIIKEKAERTRRRYIDGKD